MSERERENVHVSKREDKKITRLLIVATMSVYSTFLRANYLLPHESWRSFRLVACAERQQSSLTLTERQQRTECRDAFACFRQVSVLIFDDVL